MWGVECGVWDMDIGDWGLGIEDWGVLLWGVECWGVGFEVGVWEKGVEFRDPFIPSTHIPKAQEKFPAWSNAWGAHVGWQKRYPCRRAATPVLAAEGISSPQF